MHVFFSHEFPEKKHMEISYFTVYCYHIDISDMVWHTRASLTASTKLSSGNSFKCFAISGVVVHIKLLCWSDSWKYTENNGMVSLGMLNLPKHNIAFFCQYSFNNSKNYRWCKSCLKSIVNIWPLTKVKVIFPPFSECLQCFLWWIFVRFHFPNSFIF